MIEGKNAEAAKSIRGALDVRYQDKISGTITYLPKQYAIIKKCHVKQNGNFVSMLFLKIRKKL